MIFDETYYPGMRLTEAVNALDDEGSQYDNVYTVGGNKQVVEFGIRGANISYIEFIQADIMIPDKIQKLLNKYENN